MSMILYPLRRVDLARTTEGNTYQLRVSIAGTAETLVTPSIIDGGSDWNLWFSGDGVAVSGTDDGVGDLLQFLEDTLAGHSEWLAEGGTISMSSTNRITVTATDLDIRWGDVLTTLAAPPFGFAQSDTGVSSSHTGNQTHGAWTPLISAGRHWPVSVDTREIAQRHTSGTVSLSGIQRTSNLGPMRSRRDLEYQLLTQRYALAEYADAAEPRGTAEHVIDSMQLGRPIRWYPDATVRSSVSFDLYSLRAEDLNQDLGSYLAQDERAARLRWNLKLPLRRYLA